MTEKPAWYDRHVSRETLDDLERYAALIKKWTQKINLIAPSTRADIFERHIWDSAQIYAGQDKSWVDMGSGGGLPGIVIAILRRGEGVTAPVVLIESDKRKSTFLRTCTRQLDLPVTIIDQRIENAPPAQADTVSARALSHLKDLLPLAQRHMVADGSCLFMKGATWREEIDAAQDNWRFSWEATPSKTNPDAAVIKIKDIQSV